MKLPFTAVIAFGVLSLTHRNLVAGPLDTVALEYIKDTGTESCPGEQTLRRNIAARLGRNAFDKNADRILLVQLSRRPPGFVAQINIRKKTGEEVGTRTLSTAEGDCEELAMAMELAISIAIDPMYLMREPPLPEIEPATAAAPKEELEPTNRRPTVPPPAPLKTSQEKTQKATVQHLSFGLITASSGRQSFGITGSFRQLMQTQPFSWAVEARVDLPRTHQVFSFGTVTTGHASVAAIVCKHLQAYRLCGSVNVGVLYSQDDLFGKTLEEYTPYLSGGPRAAYEFVFSDTWSVEVGGTILVRVNQIVWEGSSLEFSLGLRSRWRLPK